MALDPARPLPDPNQPIDPSAATVLVIDDEAIVREMVETLLEAFGYRVLLAEDGFAAQRVFQAHRDEIDLVLLDMIMPQLDGLETLRALQQLEPTVKVLVSSGYDRDRHIEQMLEQGAIGVVMKPYELEELREAVEQGLAS